MNAQKQQSQKLQSFFDKNIQKMEKNLKKADEDNEKHTNFLSQ